ncbi:MAG: SurA N-terminal domain-containing protein [Nitrospirae bacterium]|nr:SurA N-terminal domain-containing protein [Nitrospirota bacterium]
MLKIMRSHKFFTVFILGAITVMISVAFIFYGIGPKSKTENNIVASVGDKDISLDEYKQAYDNAYRRAWDSLKNEEEIKKMKLKERVLSELIGDLVLRMAAQKAGLSVSDDELQDEITKAPAFQENGVFNKSIYIRRLQLNRLTPATYENAVMEELLVAKMRRLIGETAELSAEDIQTLDLIKGNQEQLSSYFLLAKRELAVKAYVEGLKRQMKITINKDFVS